MMTIALKNKILEDAEVISRLMLTEIIESTCCKIPKRQLDIATIAMQILNICMRNGFVYDLNRQLKNFDFNKITPGSRGNLFFYLGILTGIYEGLSGGEEISKILKEFSEDLFKAL